MDTLSLKKATRLSAKSNESRFNRSLDILQADFRILPVGISEAGTWKYAFMYDTVHHHMPDLIKIAHSITSFNARQYLLETYMKTVGACPVNLINKLFRWGEAEMKSTIDYLVRQEGILKRFISKENSTEWIVHPSFMEIL